MDVVQHLAAELIKPLAPSKPTRRDNHREVPRCQFLGLLNEVLIDGRGAPPVTAIAKLIWRIADDYVEFHFEDLLGVPGMNEAVGVGFEFSAPCVVFLVCSAEFAAPIFPGVLNALE